MASTTVVIKVRVAWWFTHLYLPGLRSFMRMARFVTGRDMQPKMNRVYFWAEKAIKIDGRRPSFKRDDVNA